MGEYGRMTPGVAGPLEPWTFGKCKGLIGPIALYYRQSLEDV